MAEKSGTDLEAPRVEGGPSRLVDDMLEVGSRSVKEKAGEVGGGVAVINGRGGRRRTGMTTSGRLLVLGGAMRPVTDA